MSRVTELLDELKALHDTKNSDYADSKTDPFRNFRTSETIGIPAWKGALVRMMDKWMRIENLVNKENRGEGPAVVNESLIDTLKDNAVYSLIVIALYEEANKTNQGRC